MKDHLREAIRQKLGDALELPFPKLTAKVAGRRGQTLSTLDGTYTFLRS
jgi:hypothetical protein